MSAIRAVLFVCTGNICRSSTAEGVFRDLLVEAGLGDAVRADSAGTHGYHVGEPPDSRTVAAALERGFDLSDQRARRVNAGDFTAFDLILAMDREHLSILRRMAPGDFGGDVALFLDHLPESGMVDVPDPWYGEAEGFEVVLDLVEAGCERLVDRVRASLPEPGAPDPGR